MINNLFQKYGTLIMVVLVVGALALGYGVYKQYAPQFASKATSQANQYTPSGSQAQDEKNVLNTPGPNATDAEKKQHFLLAQQIAKDAPFLDMTGCKANPAVFKAMVGKAVQIKNQDSTRHTIILTKDQKVEIPANGTNAVSVDFSRGRGVYGYGCDNSKVAVGMFLVEQ